MRMHCCAVVGIWALGSGAAFAQSSEADALFQQGRALMSQGNLPAACQAFSASLRLDDALGTLLNLAYCHEQQAKLPQAWQEYESARTRAAAEHQDKRARFSEQRLASLEKRLAFLSLDLDAVGPHATVLIDGVPADRARAGVRLPVLPGDRRVEVRAPGCRPWFQTFGLGASAATLRIVVPPLQPDTAVAPRTTAPRQASARRTWGYLVGAVGLASVATGTYFGVRTLSTKEAADADCVGNACNDRGLELYADARRFATISTVTIGAGAAAIAASAWLLLFDQQSEPTASAAHGQSTAVWARISRDQTGIQLTGAW